MTGSVRSFSRFTDVGKAMPLISRAFAVKVAEDLQAKAMQNIQAMGAIDTGNLLNSGEVLVEDGRIIVIFNAEYSFWVHQGTRRMAGRPYLLKALEDVRNGLPGDIGLEVRLGGIGL